MKRPKRKSVAGHNGRSAFDLRWIALFAAGTLVGAFFGLRKFRKTGGNTGNVKPLFQKKPSALAQQGEWSERRAHEAPYVSLVLLGGTLAVLLIGAFIMQASLWLWLEPRIKSLAPGHVPPRTQSVSNGSPRLQLSPELDFREYLLQQNEGFRASSSGGRIPIDQAIETVLEARGAQSDVRPVSPLEMQQQRSSRGRSQ